MEYRVSPLGYPCSALEPYLDAETMLVHHEQYYKAYAQELNRIRSLHPELRGNSVQELVVHVAGVPESIRDAVRNYAGGCLNHEIFFSLLRPRRNRYPTGVLGEAIASNFGDFDAFRRKFDEAALGLVGSGWAWLVCSHLPIKPALQALGGGRLRIMTTQNHDNPFSAGWFPLLGLDLWEHAYHHRYRNDRRAYVAAWWQVVDWRMVERRFETWEFPAVAPLHEPDSMLAEPFYQSAMLRAIAG